MKIKISIKHYLTGSVLFEFEKENNTIKDTLLEAIKEKVDLRGSDLSWSDLSGIDLRWSNLRGSDLRGSDLSWSDLSWSDLSWSDLRWSDLRGSDLRGSDLRGSDLSGIDLRWSDLHGSDLRGSDLHGSDLSEVKNLDSDKTNFWWHIHHEKLVEYLNEPLRARINYIKKVKAKTETSQQIKLRLKLLKPVLGDIPSNQEGWEKLHKKECKKCPFNGKTIFSETYRERR